MTAAVEQERTVTTVEQSVVVTREEIVRQVVSAGSQGPRGPQGPEGPRGADGSIGLIVNFAYGDATPAPLATALAGKRIYSVALHIYTPFDGADAALQIGPAGAPDSLMSSEQNDPATAGQYEVYPDVAYPSDTGLYLTITPGSGASQGDGQAILLIEP